jgi:hypothetical protein
MNYLHYCNRAILVIFAFSIVASEVPLKHGQDKPKESDLSTKKGLRLSAALEGELFTPKSILSVKLEIKNESKSTVYIYKQLGFGPGGFRLTILDANNSWVPPNLIRETFPDPVLSKEDLKTIGPGKSIEETIEIHLRDYEITPGDHTLKIEYVSPVAPSPVTDGHVVLMAGDGPLKAKDIRFKVLASSPG